MTTATDQCYPLVSPDGSAIPLEIIRATGLTQFNFAAGVAAAIVFPASYESAYLFSTKDCILRQDATALPAGLVAGTDYPNTMFIPANVLISVKIFSTAAQLLGIGSGTLYVSAFQQWQALNLKSQVSTG